VSLEKLYLSSNAENSPQIFTDLDEEYISWFLLGIKQAEVKEN